MPTIFAAADALSSAAVSHVFGETLQLIPWNGASRFSAGAQDDTRQIQDFIGALTGAIGSQNLKGDASGENFLGSVTTQDRMISVDQKDWPAQGREKDRIRAIEQAGQPLYEITSIVPDRVNRIIVNLVAVPE